METKVQLQDPANVEKAAQELAKLKEPISVFIVSCSKDEKYLGNHQQNFQISQILTLIKTIFFFTEQRVIFHLIINKSWVSDEVLKGLEDLGGLMASERVK